MTFFSNRHRIRAGVAMFAVLLPAAVPTAAPVAHARAGSPVSMRWGAHVVQDNAPTELAAVVNLENAVGRRFSVSRVYSQWGEAFPDAFETSLNYGGRTLLLSVKPRRSNGANIGWAQIAAAQPGSALYNEMKQLGDQFRTFGDPMYFIFHHEPEADSNTAFGTSADYVAAWRKLVTVIRGQGATNVKFLWTMIDYSFTLSPPDRRAAMSWYPGDAYVDAIGEDAYNWYTCRGRGEPWRSLQEIIDPLRVFGAAHADKELWLPEFGTVEDPAVAGRKGQWLRDTATLFAAPGWEQFRGVAYFHDADQNSPACRWYLDTSPTSISGAAAAGAAPVFGGVVVGPPCVNVGISCGAIATQGAVRIRRP